MMKLIMFVKKQKKKIMNKPDILKQATTWVTKLAERHYNLASDVKLLVNEIERLQALLNLELSFNEQYEAVIVKLGEEIERLKKELGNTIKTKAEQAAEAWTIYEATEKPAWAAYLAVVDPASEIYETTLKSAREIRDTILDALDKEE